jgi:hypothetical protein
MLELFQHELLIEYHLSFPLHCEIQSFLEADDPFSGRHYFITSNWEEMDLAGNIVRYRVSRAVC